MSDMSIIDNYTKSEQDYLKTATVNDDKRFSHVHLVQKITSQDYFIKKIFLTDVTKSKFDHIKDINFLIKMQNTSMPFAILENLSLPSDPTKSVYIMTKLMKNRDLGTVLDYMKDPFREILTSWDNSKKKPLDQILGEPELQELDDTQKMKIIYGSAFGFNQMHKNGVVHGNIRPSSILLSNECEPLITDFIYMKDIICNREYKDTCDKDHLAYMAPESLNEANQLDSKSDVYSFSVIVLQMFDPKLTFPRKYDPFQVKQKILIDFIESDKTYNIPKGVPEPFANILKQNLSRNPDDRGTMENFLDYFNDPNSEILFPGYDETIFKEYVAKLQSAL